MKAPEFSETKTGRQPNGVLVLRTVAMPRDTNPSGDIFGGWIMSQVDIAGSVVAHRAANGRVVTVAVNEFQFHFPVYVGDLVTCYAEVVKTGRTSLTVFVEVYAERRRLTEECIKVTEATVTYVAIDESGRPRPVN